MKMKAKHIVSNPDEIKKLVISTIENMATIVGATLGPGGNPVLIERDGLPPLITKDGVSVAKHIGVADSAANTIVEAAKEICLNTARDAGDGTTTAIVLANAIVKQGFAFVADRPKYNPQRMINELNDCYRRVVVPFLAETSIPVKDNEQLNFVAQISANGDKEIADVVVKAVIDAGDDGTVLIHEGQDGRTYVEVSEGYIVTSALKDLGQIGPAFINDKAGQQVKMDKGWVVLYDGSMHDLKVPGLIQDAVADDGGFSDGTPIIVFAHAFSDTVLDKFAQTTKSGLTVVPVKTQRSGLPNGASMFLDDMAAYTGATVFNPGTVEDLDSDGLGEFDSARINMYETFIQATPDPEAIDRRIVELKSVMDAAFSEMDKTWVRAAIAKLTGGVSSIYVGGSSDLEIREKKARVEDAVEAVRSAIAEGIVVGGCTTHLVLSSLITNHPDATEAWSILAQALHAPFALLLSNCGEDKDLVMSRLSQPIYEAARLRRMSEVVFDANRHEFADPFVVGVIEPAKVLRVSIGNALSVASLLTTLGGLVVMPRNQELEAQKEIADQAFKSLMENANNDA